MPRLFIILFLVYLVGNLYILFRGWQALKTCKKGMRIGFVLLYLVLAALFPAQFLIRSLTFTPGIGHIVYEVGTGWLVFSLYMAMGLLLTDVLYVAGKFARWKAVSVPQLRTRFRKVSFIVVFLLVISVLSVGYYRYQHPATQVINIVINKPLTSGASQLKVVAVSDVHLGYGTDKRQLQRYVKMINELHPDLVLIAGDLIDNNVTPLWEQRMHDDLNRIQAPLGVYMVPGNHEYISGIRSSEKFIDATQIRYLRDRTVQLPNGLVIAGRDDSSNGKRLSLPALLADTDKRRPVILLDHQPRNLREGVKAGIDLQFSGHTHSGQIWPLSLWVKRLFEVSHGMKQTGSTTQYVSSGLSLWGPPFRIGTQSELVVFNLTFKK